MNIIINPGTSVDGSSWVWQYSFSDFQPEDE